MPAENDQDKSSGGKPSNKEILEMGLQDVHERNQYLPGESHDSMYVSRLECLKAAIEWHIQRVLVQYPEKRVVLVTCKSGLES